MTSLPIVISATLSLGPNEKSPSALSIVGKDATEGEEDNKNR